jgi:hypothetical protein
MRKICAILIVLVSSVALPQRTLAQHQGHSKDAHILAERVKTEVWNDWVEKAVIFRLGPIRLPARSSHALTPQPPETFFLLPFDGWITSYMPRLVDESGKPVPGRLLHHVAFWNVARPDFLCPNKEEHIFGAGGEMNEWPELAGFGYRVGMRERIRVTSMFHNPTDTDYPAVYLEVRMNYRDSASGEPLRSVYPAWFDVQECRASSYSLSGSQNVTRGRFKLPQTGTLLGVGGHLHDFGKQVAIFNTSRNENIASLDAKLDTTGRIQSMPSQNFAERGGYKLNRGEVVEVTAAYAEGRPHQEVMGIVVGYFVPEDEKEMAMLKMEEKGKKKK